MGKDMKSENGRLKCRLCKCRIPRHRANRRSVLLREFCSDECGTKYREKKAYEPATDRCRVCDETLPEPTGRGRPAKTCSEECARKWKHMYHCLYDGTIEQRSRRLNNYERRKDVQTDM